MDINYLLPSDPFYWNRTQADIEAENLEDDELALTPRDRARAARDLSKIVDYRLMLEPLGYLGVAGDCPDCTDMHYYDWDFVMSNTCSVALGDDLLIHEGPTTDDERARYASWDYCRGSRAHTIPPFNIPKNK
ncbi:MAG: DUF5319 family protein [Corynebacterium sp.]|nr:DUF5319 family protein [Corynebacterium sp.]